MPRDENLGRGVAVKTIKPLRDEIEKAQLSKAIDNIGEFVMWTTKEGKVKLVHDLNFLCTKMRQLPNSQEKADLISAMHPLVDALNADQRLRAFAYQNHPLRIEILNVLDSYETFAMEMMPELQGKLRKVFGVER